LTDEELMAAYMAGDRDSFTILFRRWAPRLHKFFLRSLGDAASAEDLLQTTFVRIHQSRDTFRPGCPLKPWIFTVAARVRQNELRRRRRLPESAGEEALAAAEEQQAEPPDLPERPERDAAVREAIDRLPESQRVVIHLSRLEQMTYAEIAKVLGTSEGAVKLRAFRAYERLRKALAALREDAA